MYDQSAPETIIDFTNKHQVSHEMHMLAMDISTPLEKIMSEKDMPPVTATKQDLGESWCGLKIDPSTRITITPKKYTGRDQWREIIWEVERVNERPERELPAIEVSPMDKNELRSHTEFPRHYRAWSENEKTFMFTNEKGTPIGWVAVSDEQSRTGCYLSYVEVIPRLENKGYGEAILGWLKNRYQTISLGMTAYDTAGRGATESIQRLRRFYVKNGFTAGDGVSFSWSKKEPNLEESKPGEKLIVTDWLTADGTRYSNNELRRIYLEKLHASGKLEDALGIDGARAALAWLELRKQAKLAEKQHEGQEFQNSKVLNSIHE